MQDIHPTPAEEGETYVGIKQVRSRYGNCSDMWVWRRLRDESGFPKPIDISGRRFWKLSELIAWERKRAVEAA
jgi:predicted DNA-binding transcriptional regulator AlpA